MGGAEVDDPYRRGGVSRAALTEALQTIGASEAASHSGLAEVLKLREGRAVSLAERAEALARAR